MYAGVRIRHLLAARSLAHDVRRRGHHRMEDAMRNGFVLSQIGVTALGCWPGWMTIRRSFAIMPLRTRPLMVCSPPVAASPVR
jgi:hypothetical protein